MIAAALAVVGRVPVWLWLVAGAVAAAAVWVWIERGAASEWRKKAEAETARAALLQGQLERVTEINAENLETLARIRADHDRAMTDVATDLARARKAGTRLTVVQQEIARDPDATAALADRCPALDRFLDRMHGNGAAAPAGNEDRAGSGVAPRGAAGVRPGAAAAARRP